jgi:diaminopropionate ammonia-lyase
MSPLILRNPLRTETTPAGYPPGAEPGDEPLELHRRLPGYAPTRLVDARELAAHLGVGKVWIKDESLRLGLPSFKILGASWATYGALAARLGDPLREWSTVEELSEQLAPLRPLTLVAATEGNHGRAVAHVAALLGLRALIFVPAGMAAARIAAIEGEGAQVSLVDGTYDDAVRAAAEAADERHMVISDTSWPGYEDVPRWVIDGYSTIFREIDAELERRGEPGPDLVIVQMGVGALAAAVVRHYRRAGLTPQPVIAGVEPVRAACVLESLRAGRIVELPGPHDSIMAGLNCGLASIVAWPLLSVGIDLAVAVEDERARQAMRMLAACDVVAGETGAAGVAGLLELLRGPEAEQLRPLLGITSTSHVLALCTEGATDPAAYERITGTRAQRP